MEWLRGALAAVLLASAVAPTYPATFNAGDLVKGSEGQWISIDGQIFPDDFQAFERAATRLTARKVTVVLSGPGGNLIAAIRIGEFVRLKGWGTFVATECNSACAAIWLAGHPRMMGRAAKIGFHAASVAGQENGTSNALYGAYMSRLGLDYDAVDWATTAGPRDISYLSPAKAKELGIDVGVIDPEPETKQAAATPATPALAPVRMPPSVMVPSILAPAATSLPAAPNPGRDCTAIIADMVPWFPGAFNDCITQPAVDSWSTSQWHTMKTWDQFLPATGRYVTRTLQACSDNCGVYRLIARDHDASGGSNGGSLCHFFIGGNYPKGWSSCQNTEGVLYELKPGSINWLLRIAAGEKQG
jgi:hypothetical protein